MLINIKTTTKQLTKKRARHYTSLHIICFEHPNKSPLKWRWCVPQIILEWKVSNLKNPPIIPVAFTPEYNPPHPQFPPCEWIMLLWEWLKRSLQFPLHKLDLQVIYNWKTDDTTSGTREVENLIGANIYQKYIQMHHREKNTIILIIVITIIIMNNYDNKNFKIRW